MPYDPEFIPGETVPLPTLGPTLADVAFANGVPIDHSRFSIIMHGTRGLAICTAHTIDGATLMPKGSIPRDKNFKLDPIAPRPIQTDNDKGYSGRDNPWDRGHLVRRRSMHWGDRDEAVAADEESFYWTNIAPQHETLHDKAWGRIEDWMLEHTHGGNGRAAVFTGPILSPDDPTIINKPGEEPFQIPAGFWKVIAVKPDGLLRAAGFLVWQRDFDKEKPVAFAPYLEQVRITTLEFITGLSFGELRDRDPLQFGTLAATPEDETDLDTDVDVSIGVAVRGGETLEAIPMARAAGLTSRKTAIRSPGDIFI